MGETAPARRAGGGDLFTGATRPVRTARLSARKGPRTVGRIALAVLVLVALGTAALAAAHRAGGEALALSTVFGAVFGIVLQRSRFCFFCAIREWFEEREPDGVLGLLAALAAGTLLTALVLGAWLPDPGVGRLPPDAFIGPIAWTLVIGGLLFGAGMTVSGSCLSAHLYRLGEGSPTAPFALLGALGGFVLGFAVWNGLYLRFVVEAPVVWLPERLGYPGWVAATLLVVLLLAWVPLSRSSPRRVAAAEARAAAGGRDRPFAPLRAPFAARWPGWLGGLAVGVLGAFSYLRVAPLGVTAELSARARDLGASIGATSETLLGFETLRGCVSVVADAVLSPNGAFVGALVLASFAAALLGDDFRPQRLRLAHVVRGVTGGMLLGFGAMLALGCTVGTLLSGITSGALSGWVFGAAMLVGLLATRRLASSFERA